MCRSCQKGCWRFLEMLYCWWTWTQWCAPTTLSNKGCWKWWRFLFGWAVEPGNNFEFITQNQFTWNCNWFIISYSFLTQWPMCKEKRVDICHLKWQLESCLHILISGIQISVGQKKDIKKCSSTSYYRNHSQYIFQISHVCK